MTSSDKKCDVCRAQSLQTPATHHCLQCSYFFCGACLSQHSRNAVFSSHHVVDMANPNEASAVFCKVHREQPVRYFCKDCNTMLCGICTMTHSTDHKPVSIDRHVIKRYQEELADNLRSIKSKLNVVSKRTKYLETIRQTYQKALYDTQTGVRRRTDDLIKHIREQERRLLADAQQRMDAKMRMLGLDSLGEMNYHRANIENLHADVQSVILGSPQQCLMAYDDLIGRMKAVSEAALPILQAPKLGSVLKFVPSEDSAVELMVGQLQEVNISECHIDEELSPTADISPPFFDFTGPLSPSSKKGLSKRAAILNAISPTRKSEVKIGKVKAFNATLDKSKAVKAINADQLMSSSQDDPQPSSSTSPPPPTSPTPALRNYLSKPSLIFNVDQIGGWPGKIMNPSGVDFLPDGSVVVAEAENRLQVFDRQGQSLRIIGWGKIKPHEVAVTRDGSIAITDNKDKCIKVFSAEGELKSIWGTGMFGQPAGIAMMACGNFVVTDVDKHVISIHTHDGSLLTQFGSWGCGDYQFNSPSYVTVNQDEEIFISDSGNGCIKVFDQRGKFLRKFSLSASGQGTLRRPQGVCIDTQGNVLIADRDNHRISLHSRDGTFNKHILDKSDGLRYPCDIKASADGYVVVVETHLGFLSKEPHHAIKLYRISQ